MWSDASTQFLVGGSHANTILFGVRTNSKTFRTFPLRNPRCSLSLNAHLMDYNLNDEFRFRSRAQKEGSNAGDWDIHNSRSELGNSFYNSIHGRRFLRDYEGDVREKNLRRKEWESQTGRKVKKKHGNRILSILKALENTSDIDEALEPWKGRLKIKEQTILLNEQWKWDRACALFSWLKDQENYKPNVYLYNIMLKTCGRARKWGLVQKLWSEMQNKEVIPSNFTYSTLIDAYARVGRKEDAMFWFQTMKERGLQPDEVTISTLINMYKRFGDVEEGRKVFECLSVADNIPYDDLTTDGKGTEHVVIMNEERDSCGGVDTEIENTPLQDPVTIGGSSKLEHRFQGQELQDHVRESTKSPKLLNDEFLETPSYPKNADTYNIMMDLYARGGQFAEASRLFGDMVKAGVSPDIVTHNSMIHICGRVGRVQEAKAIFKKMGQNGPSPDIATYNTLISMFIKRGEKQNALAFYKKMKEGGVVPDSVTFRTLLRNTLISEANIGPDVDLPKRIISVIEELAAGFGEAMPKSEITLTIMLNLYKKSGMTKEAYAVARRLWNADLLTNLVSFNSVLEMSRSVTEAKEVFERMIKKGITPDVSTYNRLAAILKKAGLMKEGLKQIEIADSAGLSLSLHTLTTAASLYGHAGMHEEALEACEALRTSGFTLDIPAYTAMIYAFGIAGRLDEALRVSMEMQANGLEPNVVTYTTVVSVYAKMGLLEGVTRLFKRMKRAGCEPDEVTYNAVIKSYKDAGREDLAAMVFQEKQFARYILEQSNRDRVDKSNELETLDSKPEMEAESTSS